MIEMIRCKMLVELKNEEKRLDLIESNQIQSASK
jgi:hypothetical protein